jgi:pimeloyl-ACP methyl ester carboxylesterase
MKRILTVSLTFVLAVTTMFGVLLPYSTAAASGFKAHIDLPLNLEGTLNGASYKIRVPLNWNGTLLVYAHGYHEELQAPPIDAAPGGPLGENTLLSMGYAVAGTTNRNAGWAVKEGIQNTLALTEFFKGHAGNPEHVILWGFSMGSVIALESIEKYPGIYDGAIAGCGLAAGAPLNFDQALALSLAYDVAFGWSPTWGPVGDVRDNLDFDTVVLPVLLSDQDPIVEPLYAAKVEFIRLVCDLPAEVNTIGPFWFSWLFTDMFFATQARGELERRANGPVAQNLDHIYELSAAEEAYLGSMGLTDAAGMVSQMNARTNIEACAPARKYLERYADFTGDLKRPVITIHTRVDELVREANEDVYRELVEAAGKGDMLVQVFTDSVGHSRFTGEQLLATVLAMDYWLETGEKPSTAVFFPPILGFVPNFVPPPWPFLQ